MNNHNNSTLCRRRRRQIRSITVAALSFSVQHPIVSDAFQLEVSTTSRPRQPIYLQIPRLSASRSSLEIPGLESARFTNRKASLLEPPMMFLSGGGVLDIGVWSDLFSSSRFGGRSYAQSGLTKQQQEQQQYHQGVLGFSIQEEISARTEDEDSVVSASPTSLSAHGSGYSSSTTSIDEPHNSKSVSHNSKTVSNVDSSVWNNFPKHLEEWYADSSPIKNQLASTSYRNTEPFHMLPAWFPWLPTHSQICALKLDELKVACVERGLKKSGNKAELQERMWEWAQQQHQRRVQELRGETAGLNMGLNLLDAYGTNTNHLEQTKGNPFWEKQQHEILADDLPSTNSRPLDGVLQASSLAEWTRTNLKPLLNKREELKRQKLEGKKPAQQQQPIDFDMNPTKEYLSDLKRAFKAPSSRFSNLEVSQMYLAAKHADQVGDRETSKRVLLELKEATPNDARIFRRLARLESEEGNLDDSIAVLHEGLRLHPKNSHLWQGLGNFQLQAGALHQARESFLKAITLDPSFPNAYHALGTLEHTQGNIASAMKVLKQGLDFCPTNHRLHHAMGDLYQEAKVLDMAEKSYRRALQYGPPVSHCFAYSALASVAYENGDLDQCRHWLRKSVSINNGRHAQGWVALAQLEESEGRTEAARAVSIAAVTMYERGLVARGRRVNNEVEREGVSGSPPSDPVVVRKELRQNVPVFRSGDRFLKVYRNWARLEERYGDFDTVEEVYKRATAAFPTEWKLYLDWAEYHAKRHHTNRARSLFTEACRVAANRYADPYRIYAEYEMSLGDYSEARVILYRGAHAISQSTDGGFGNQRGMAELLHTWAVCEWYLGNLSRAESLFDHALRLTDPNEDGAKMRSFILFSVASLEFFKGEHILAQHCVSLCLKEHSLPGGDHRAWELWADVAAAMDNHKLSRECREQAEKVRKQSVMQNMSSLLAARRSGVSSYDSIKGDTDMQLLMRRDPWYHKLFDVTNDRASKFFDVRLPVKEQDPLKEQDPTVSHLVTTE